MFPEDEEETEMRALDALRSDAHASRLGEHLPEDQRGGLVITITPGGSGTPMHDPAMVDSDDVEDLADPSQDEDEMGRPRRPF